MSDPVGTALISIGLCGIAALFIAAAVHDHKSPEHACAAVYGIDTRDYALCVYELPRHLREKP